MIDFISPIYQHTKKSEQWKVHTESKKRPLILAKQACMIHKE